MAPSKSSSGKKLNITLDGRPSEPVSKVDGTTAWTQASRPLGVSIPYHSSYASTLVARTSSGPA
ncbi:MAG: hypothetical protein IPO81_12640 [Kouleothrix sp.]|nr:hypothetical protein [Kouleothrix sp.]